MKNILRKAALIVRRLWGVNQIIEQQQLLQQQLVCLQQQMFAQKHLLDRAISYLEFTSIDVERMKASNKYQNVRKLIQLLSPMDILGAKYIRVGRDYDGGYIMLDDFATHHIDAAYSFGISDDVSWDEDIAGLGIDIYMYDHTIEALPRQHPLFHFFKKGVSGNPSDKGLVTLSSLVAENGHQESKSLILKMDIEGYEWSVIEETPSDVLNQFSQIVIEFHGINPNETQENLTKVFAALEKINRTHQSIHVHANGFCSVSWLRELALPHLIEVTYVRRSDYRDQLIPNKRSFPTGIDQSTFPWLPDVCLGLFAMSDFNAFEDNKKD